MNILGQKTTVKQYFGVKHHYHTPVLYQQKRFYLIKIDKITNVSQLLMRNNNTNQPNNYAKEQKSAKEQYKLNYDNNNITPSQNNVINYQVAFQIGCRSSTETIQIDFDQYQKYAGKKQRISQVRNQDYYKRQNKKILKTLQQSKTYSDLHIFPFQRQQVMTITLKSNQNTQQYGYAIMPLVPFIKMPQTKHQVQVDLMFFNDKKQIRNQVAAVLHISLHLLDNFKGSLIVQPVEAFLGRNLAQIGQMSPIIRMFLRENEFSTQRIEQGGMRPNWQSSNKFCYFNIPIQSGFDQLFVYLFYNREVTMDEIIGYFKVDLQDQGIFKQGESMQNFIKQQQLRRKKDKEDENWKNYGKQESKLSITYKNKKLTSNDVANLNKIQKKQFLAKQKRNQLQQYQLKWLYSHVQRQRTQLIVDILQNVKTISSQQSPQIVTQKTQAIFQLYQQNEKQILSEFQKSCKVNVNEFGGQDLEYIKQKSMSSLKGYLMKQEIRKMFMRQVQMLLRFAQQKMEEIKVPLLYTPLTEEGQDSKPVQVGKLTLKYLFLYEFDLPDKEQQHD